MWQVIEPLATSRHYTYRPGSVNNFFNLCLPQNNQAVRDVALEVSHGLAECVPPILVRYVIAARQLDRSAAGVAYHTVAVAKRRFLRCFDIGDDLVFFNAGYCDGGLRTP